MQGQSISSKENRASYEPPRDKWFKVGYKMQMLLHSLNRDFSRKYYPRFDEATYDKEMEWTEGALADFFDRPAQ